MTEAPVVRRAVISVGSNLGDRMGQLQGALDELAAQGVAVVSVSSVYETAPVGGPEQDHFLNAVAMVETSLAPHDLLSTCQRIEASHDRVRTVRWGPRTLDLDIIAIEGVTLDDVDLTVPHPRAHERAFVCVPWSDVDPTARVGDRAISSLDLDASGVVRRDDLMLLIPEVRR
jgi:2-amino-4-hydroxy-6-hydroxymethyldihydropteridine diphosphokinase